MGSLEDMALDGQFEGGLVRGTTWKLLRVDRSHLGEPREQQSRESTVTYGPCGRCKARNVLTNMLCGTPTCGDCWDDPPPAREPPKVEGRKPGRPRKQPPLLPIDED